jgi:hypothetical protein
MSRETSPSTVNLRATFDAFLAEFETEYRRQSTKLNLSSERRMRQLLRGFRARVYEPYRDATLQAPEPQQEF